MNRPLGRVGFQRIERPTAAATTFPGWQILLGRPSLAAHASRSSAGSACACGSDKPAVGQKTFGGLTRFTIKIDTSVVEMKFGTQKVRAPRDAVQSALTRRRTVGLAMKTELVLVGSGTELGVLDLSRFNNTAGEEAAEWINAVLKQHLA